MIDESINGCTPVIIKEPEITESKSIYKAGLEHRFFINPEKRFKADAPIINYLVNNHNQWSTVRQIVIDTGMASRTVYFSTDRLVRHGVLESKQERRPDSQGYSKNTHLYRLIPKFYNGTTGNKRRNSDNRRRNKRTN